MFLENMTSGDFFGGVTGDVATIHMSFRCFSHHMETQVINDGALMISPEIHWGSLGSTIF